MSKNFDNFIWYEKYRPTSIDELVIPKTYREKFEEYIEEKNIPHLLLFGPQGSGKTTLASILMDTIPSQRLILNASGEDRGIATIRGKVKQFAASESFKSQLKIVFMDEADGITPDAQFALKNTIETYSKNCRFIFTANNVDRIRKEIKSRSTLFEFSQYPIKRLKKYLFSILESEKIKAKEEDLEKLIDSFYPDIRSIINNLQVCSVNGKFDPDLITATSIDVTKIQEFISKGYVRSLRKLWTGMTDFTFVYKYLFDDFIYTQEEIQRVMVAETIAEYLHRDSTIADRELNITTCCIMLMRICGTGIHFDK